MFNFPTSIPSLLGSVGSQQTSTQTNDVREFESILGSSGGRLSNEFSFQNTNGSNNRLLDTVRKSSDELTDASAKEIAQRVVDQKNAMHYETKGSATKKATEVFKELKF